MASSYPESQEHVQLVSNLESENAKCAENDQQPGSCTSRYRKRYFHSPVRISRLTLPTCALLAGNHLILLEKDRVNHQSIFLGFHQLFNIHGPIPWLGNSEIVTARGQFLEPESAGCVRMRLKSGLRIASLPEGHFGISQSLPVHIVLYGAAQLRT